MPRYDHDRPGPWDSGRDHGQGPWGPPAYGRDVRPLPHGVHREAEWVGDDGEWSSGPVYGPARYGLGPYHQRLRSRRRPDDEVRKDVQDALFYDTWVDAEAIAVDVRDGVVTLRGELPDYHEVRYATDDAWDVEGVRGVHCQLSVNRARRPRADGIPQRRPASAGLEGGNG